MRHGQGGAGHPRIALSEAISFGNPHRVCCILSLTVLYLTVSTRASYMTPPRSALFQSPASRQRQSWHAKTKISLSRGVKSIKGWVQQFDSRHRKSIYDRYVYAEDSTWSCLCFISRTDFLSGSSITEAEDFSPRGPRNGPDVGPSLRDSSDMNRSLLCLVRGFSAARNSGDVVEAPSRHDHEEGTDEPSNPFVKLPPELLLSVLEFVEASAADDGSSVSQATRKFLSACASTCKQWSRQLQPLLFQWLTLRSHNDLRGLVELLDSPTSRTSRYIQRIIIEETPDFHSWAHIALRQLRGRLPQLYSLEHVSTLEEPSTRRDHPLFPSSVDTLAGLRSGFRTVAQLTLQNYRFHDFKAFARVVLAFPMLEELRCTRLSWGTAPPPTQALTRAADTMLRLVHVANCENRWLLLWLFSSSGRRGGCRRLLDCREIPILIDMARILLVREDEASLISEIRLQQGKG